MAPLDKGVKEVKKKSYCPICGSRCGGELGIECPNHGVVNPVYDGYEDYQPDPPGKQKQDNEYVPTGVPLNGVTAAVLDTNRGNQLPGHPVRKNNKDEIDPFLSPWKLKGYKYFDGADDSETDKNVIILPSLEEEDEDFEICEHGDTCPHIIETWVVLFGDDR